MKLGNKRGLAPLIATVLLIVVAIALFAIIFMWLQGFFGESIQKDGTPIETVCMSVNFRLALSSNKENLQITNLGDVPLYEARVFNVTGSGTSLLGEVGPISQASSATIDVSGCEKLRVLPVLLGTSQGYEQEYVCENQAKEISC